MVKTSNAQQANGQTRFGTLSNVVDEIRVTNKLLDKQSSAITDFIQNQQTAAALGKKDALESGREGKGKGPRFGAGRMLMRGGAEMTGIPALGRGMKMLLAPITAGLGFLMGPLKFLGKLLIKGGPIALLFTGMYMLFKGISDNPKFKETIESIKETWNDKIVPLFTSIKESISSLMGNADVQATFESIRDWFSNFKIQIQDFVLGSLATITDVIAGVLEGVDLLLKGDWKEGISKIGSTLFGGIKDFFDNAITNILEMFGLDFGEGGSFLKSAGEIIDSLLLNMTAKWNEFKQGIKDTWAGMVNFFTGDSGYVMTTINNIKQWITDKWNGFKDTIKATWEGMVEDVKMAFVEAVDLIIVQQVQKIKDLKDGMVAKWGEIKDSMMEAITKVAIWFAFKPKELGLMLEEKWIETKGKFMEKLASFAGMITTLPAQLKLGLLESLKGTWLGDKLVSDDMVADARAQVSSGQAFAESLVASSRSKTQEDLARIAKERMELDAAKRNMEKAAQIMINQNNAGGTTVNTTNLSSDSGSVGDPYASSYMGRGAGLVR